MIRGERLVESGDKGASKFRMVKLLPTAIYLVLFYPPPPTHPSTKAIYFSAYTFSIINKKSFILD